MKAETIDDLQSTAAFSRDRVNPLLFNYALSVALLHRSDTSRLDIPLFAGVFPDRFFDSKKLDQAREMITMIPEGSRKLVSKVC
jgi:tyrosinase